MDKSIKILAFDTAANACSAALWAEGEVVAARHEAMARGQAEALAPMIADLFGEALLPGDGLGGLDAIAVTVGPGTFTGVRVGLATARALALPRKLPVIALTTIDAICWQTPAVEGPVLVALETKREDFYVQLFGRDGEVAMAPAAMTVAEILPLLPPPPMSIVGDGSGRLEALLAETGRHGSRQLGDVMPVAAEFAALAARRFHDGDLGGAEPLYLRPPSVTPPAAK